jgi:hypothetical protein
VLPTALAILALVVSLAALAAARRRTPDVPADGSDAVRRDLSRLVAELQASARDQVARLDREVRRLQEAVAQAEKARLALEDARSRTPAPPPPARPAERPANPLHARIFELRDSGKDPADIGVETGLEVGEVELILGLRRMPPRA